MTEDACPKCGKRGNDTKHTFEWKYSTDSGMTNGYGKCNFCGAEFH
ncbi:hypothetical protein LCGC14_0586340 [marine sediment metagenome]|uniref:Uncharacterized protein n=1 Tax=marine sediment metagenome TaxID=412755 RepID=A0A0F9UN47_9ZZZZ